MEETRMTDVPLPQPATPSHLNRPAWLDIAYGSAAGMVSKVFEHPLDLVKVRLQSQPANEPPKFRGPVDCFLQTLKGEGVRGLYRGLSMPVMGAMAENATLFVSYNQLQQVLARFFPYHSLDTPISHMALAGAGAGIATSFVLTPIELVKCRMQVQLISQPASSITPPGPATITRQIIADQGLKGLWLGQTGTFLRESGGGVAWFLAYELTARALARRRSPTATKADLTVAELMLSGANAGIGYTVVLFPADSIKSTIQTADLLSRGQARKGFMQTGAEMYAAKGLKGLYSGCGVTTLKSAGSSALIFSIYALLENKFG